MNLIQSLYRFFASGGALVPVLALLLSGCCFSGRESQRFAGSADIIPIPGEEELELIAGGELAPEVSDEEVAVVEEDRPEVAADLPDAWLEAFSDLDSVIYFDYDLASLKATGVRILRSWVRSLKRYPQADLVVQGHTDSRGTRGYNLWLGERRAKAVQDFLAIRGIDEKRVRLISYGEEVPAVSGTNERAYALNRRAVLSVEASR